MPQKQDILETQNSFCEGIDSIIQSGESVRFFAPLQSGQRVKDFTAASAPCVGVHVGINEAGRKGLICFYFVEFPDTASQDYRSGIVLLSLVRDQSQLAMLFQPEKLAKLLRTNLNTATSIIESLKKDFLSFQRLKLMYGIYQLMKA